MISLAWYPVIGDLEQVQPRSMQSHQAFHMYHFSQQLKTRMGGYVSNGCERHTVVALR